MATVTTNFSSATSLNTALELVNSGWSLSSALSLAYAAFNSDSNVAYFTSLSSSYVSGRFVNSDDFQMWGSNLTGDPATTTELDYLFNPEGIAVSLKGNIVTYSDSTQLGYINNIVVSSAASGSISFVGYQDVASDADGTITSVIKDFGGAHIVANGVLIANDEISGYYTGATISYAGSNYAINNIALDAKASFATPEEMLAAVLSGEDSIEGSVGNDYLNGYAGNDTLIGGGGTDVAVFSGALSGYKFSNAAGVFSVVDTDPLNGNDGSDTLAQIEMLRFSDVGVIDIAMVTSDASFNVAYYLQSKLQQVHTVPGYEAMTLEQLVKALADAGFTPQSHYAQYGLVERTDPNIYFDTDAYLAAKTAQLNSDAYLGNTDWTVGKLVGALFAAGFTNAWDHFAQYGWKENINPSAAFDVSNYLDAKAAQLNESAYLGRHDWTAQSLTQVLSDAHLDPVTHYANWGISEGFITDSGLMVPQSEQVAVGLVGVTATMESVALMV